MSDRADWSRHYDDDLPMSLWRVIFVTAICIAVVVGLGFINIWLGVLSVPIMYSIQRSFLTK